MPLGPPKLPAERPGPEGGKRDANRRAKVAAICRASLELFCERGVETVTIDEVARAAGVAKGSFYRYFSDKEELVETIFTSLRVELHESFSEASARIEEASSAAETNAAYMHLAGLLAPLVAANRGALRLYLQENRSPEVAARRPILQLADDIEEMAMSLTKVARQRGLLRSDYDLRVGVLASMGAVERILLSYVKDEGLGDAKAVAQTLVGVLLVGVR